MKLISLKVGLFCILFTVFGGCKQRETNVLELKPKEIITNLSDSSYLVEVRNIATNNNIIYLVDKDANRVILMDSLNNVIKSFGRYGSGPGEFNGASNIQFFKDSLFIVSSGDKKMNVYDNFGNYIRSFQLPPQVFGSSKFVLDNSENLFFATPIDKNFPISQLDMQGKIIKGFGTWRPTSNAKGKLAHNIKDLISYNDKLISVTHGSPEIEIFTFSGILLEKFYIDNSVFVKRRLNFAMKEISKSSTNKINTYELIKDIAMYNGNLYLLIYDYDKSEGSGCNKILKIDINKKLILKTLVLTPNNWYRSFAILNNKLYAYAGSKTTELQIFISDKF